LKHPETLVDVGCGSHLYTIRRVHGFFSLVSHGAMGKMLTSHVMEIQTSHLMLVKRVIHHVTMLFFFRQVVIINGIMVDKLWSMMVNDG
jgi:hypothetical protein